MDRHFILATAGHVDHGKSSLVQALTSIDPDRLPEEKARGITIELGFAELTLQAAERPEDLLRVGIIDVPGHEDFVKNMVAGVGCVNLGLVVVAADDGWMPQTEEHLQILEYLGVREIVVALNKIDLAEEDEAFLREVILDELQGSSFAGAPIVATSTLDGRGIESLKQLLADRFHTMRTPEDRGKPRLSVDRSFSVKGHGTVVTGTLADGTLELNQGVQIQPEGLASRVRALQCFGKEVEKAVPGSRVAVNLANVSVRRSVDSAREGVARGDVVTAGAQAVSTRIIDCLVGKSNRLAGRNVPATKALKHGARVRLHHGSSNTPGRVFFLDQAELKVGERVPAEIRLEHDVMVLVGDRFVLRDWSENHTLAGGTVVDALGEVRRFRQAEQRRYFEDCQMAPDTVDGFVMAVVGRDKLIHGEDVLKHSCYSQASIRSALDDLSGSEKLVTLAGWVFEPLFWEQQAKLAGECIDSFHERHCEIQGISQTELRSHLDRRWSEGDGFDVLLGALERKGYCIEGAIIRRVDHQISLPKELESAVAQLRSQLGEKPIEPPGRKQLIGSDQADRAMRFLLNTGEVVEIGDELLFLKTGYTHLDHSIRQFLTDQGGGTVSELRQHTGVSRRIILPILEHLDALGVTVREGDLRRLKSSGG